ncbi:MAG: formate dehydrogenase subunit alpha [Dehalococcoidia bacterium]|nr:formate dehydrogenase subunit alpha [Dehalococcoidia bacterium]
MMLDLPVRVPSIGVTVDGRAVQVPRGAMVLDAIEAARVDLPHLCKPDARGPLGACRTCLVEVEGAAQGGAVGAVQSGARLVAACHTPIAEGAAIRTDSEKAQRIRRGVLDLTLGMSRVGAGSGTAATHAHQHGLEVSSYVPRPRAPRDESNLFFALDMADCILCGRCVDACQRTQHIGAIGINGRGSTAHISVAFDAAWEDSTCTSCGQCVSQCPTGALMPKIAPARASGRVEAPRVVSAVTETTCPYCGVGCGLSVRVEDGRLAWVDGIAENGSSQGMTCVKGRFGLEFAQSEERLTHPLIRRGGKGGVLERATWDEALDLVARRFAASLGSFAGIASAKATNEDGYVMQKFVRAVMGTNNIDHCSRLCHAPSVVALQEMLGSGATSNSYADYDIAGTLLVVGSDTAQNHPVIASRLRRAVEDRDAALIVVNPIRIDLCDLAEIHLQPRPGTDVALFNAIAHVILDEGLWNPGFVEARTEGFEAWRRVVEQVTPEDAERICGVPAEDIRRAARLYARPRPGRDGEARGSCLIWGMGVTQHTNGSDNARSLINLALLTGEVGGPGNGISPLRGQNNVQGCSDSGCLPNTFPAYEPYDGPAHAKYEAAWGVDLSQAQGMQSTHMIEAMAEGDLWTMYVVGENPLISDPYLAHTREAFARLDFLVVQDIFMHETAEMADVVLPAASFAEKYGTFTNSERRVQLVRPLLPMPGEARDDWAITAEIARRVLRILERPVRGFEYENSGAIFDEMASLMPIIAGLSHARLEREGGLQWPVPDVTHPGTPRLFETEFARGRGKFMAVEQGPPAAELPSRRFPYTLITGRSLYHWHTGVITRRVPGLLGHMPVLTVDMHPADAASLGFLEGDAVQLASRRGEIIAELHVDTRMRRGELFVPFVQLQGMAANFLTNDALDVPSGIPEFKACAVRVERPGTPSRAGRGAREQRKGRAPVGPGPLRPGDER